MAFHGQPRELCQRAVIDQNVSMRVRAAMAVLRGLRPPLDLALDPGAGHALWNVRIGHSAYIWALVPN